jgi:antitoxin (DNA-binding transcriptional repressor) of toxin-antitoxin stability system
MTSPVDEFGRMLMTTVTVEEAQQHLKELIAGMSPGEKLVITQDGEPVAELTRVSQESWPSKPGSYSKPGFWISPDFDEPLEDFKEYME